VNPIKIILEVTKMTEMKKKRAYSRKKKVAKQKNESIEATQSNEVIETPTVTSPEPEITTPLIVNETKLTMNDVIAPGGAGPAIIDGEMTELEPIIIPEPKERITMQNTRPPEFLKGKAVPPPMPDKKKAQMIFMSDLPSRRK
jgi:hypothetical protein